MGRYVAENLVKNLIKTGLSRSRSRSTLILGFTFKENCPDVPKHQGNVDIINELKEYDINAYCRSAGRFG
jgi:UDP-N-acetyl-D-mannosaminuronate dehydrogenase